MDRKTLVISILIGILTNAVWVVLVELNSAPQILYLILLSLLSLILPFLVLNIYGLWKFGIKTVWDASSHKFSLVDQMKNSKKSFCFMGVSARTILDPQVEKLIIEKLLSKNDYVIKFLVFDYQETEKLKRRALEETGEESTANEWSDLMRSIIQMLLRIKNRLGQNGGERLQIKVYKSFPVFRMLIIDDEKILLNYYAPKHFPSEMSCVELTMLKDNVSLGNAFKKQFDEIWIEASTVNMKDSSVEK